MPEIRFNPDPPPETAEYFRSKDLQPAFSWRDVWGEEHAHAFTVAKATEVSVLTEIRSELQRALDEGVPFKQFQKELTPKLKEMGWWGRQERMDPLTGELVDAQLGSPRRLKTIYRTNMRTARAAGQWERIQRSKAGLPYLMYTLGPSEHHRAHHVALEGTIRPVDDPWWSAYMGPNGWGCKCGVRQLTRAEAERRGISKPQDIVYKKFEDTRTGIIREVPAGCDPGFGHNPGVARAENLTDFLAGELTAAPARLRKTAVADLVRQPQFRRHAEGRREGALPVAALSDELADSIGSEARLVRFSQDTARKQAERHPDVAPSDYAGLETEIERATIYRDGPERLVLFYWSGGRLWRGVVKSAAEGRELYLSTLHRSNEKQQERAGRRFGEAVRSGGA